MDGWKLHNRTARNEENELLHELWLQYTFFILNKSSIPITLKSAVAEVQINARKYVLYIDEDTFLPPHEPANRSSFLCFLDIPLAGDEIGLYDQSELILQIVGEIFLEGATGEAKPQKFRRTVKCGPHLEEPYVYVGRNFKPLHKQQ